MYHHNDYDEWLQNLKELNEFCNQIKPNKSLNEDTISSLSDENLHFLYEGKNGSGFQKIYSNSEGGYFSTLSINGNPTYKGEPIDKDKFTYDKFIYEITHHNDKEIFD